MKEYKLIKLVILRGSYDRADMMKMLAAYLSHKKITQEQYDELVRLMDEGAAK